MEWRVRDLAPEETHTLRREVSADGRTDLPTMRYELDDAPGAWHLGAVDRRGGIVATSSFYPVACPLVPEAQPAFQLQFMAVDPALQRRGIGSAVMAEAIRRLRATHTILLWASARETAVRFYERFGFRTLEGSGFTPATTGRPHLLIVLELQGRSERTPTKPRVHRKRASPAAGRVSG
jgi:predicted N-acetyltransferase YhbS